MLTLNTSEDWDSSCLHRHCRIGGMVFTCAMLRHYSWPGCPDRRAQVSKLDPRKHHRCAQSSVWMANYSLLLVFDKFEGEAAFASEILE